MVGHPGADELLTAILASSADAIVAFDPKTRITAWNPAAARLFGFTEDEAIGRPVAEVLATSHPHAEIPETLQKAARGEGPFHYEIECRTKDRGLIDVSVTAFSVRNQAGEPIGLCAIYRDITARKAPDGTQTLRTHEHVLGLIESSLDAMLTVGSDLIIADANEQTVKITATGRNALIGSRFDRYFTDPERAAKGIRRTLSEGYVVNYELALKGGGDKEIPVSFNASVFRDSSGRPRGVFAVARDITQQKELEKQLRQAQAYTRGLIESSVDAMLTVDSNLVINDVNGRLAALVETPRSILVGSRFDRLFEHPERAENAVRRALKDGAITNYDLNLRTLSGKEILVSFSASIYYDTAGNAQGLFAVARDVTEQRRVEQQLREQQIYSRSLIEGSIDALMAVDPQLVITDINEETVRLSGYTRLELIHSSFPLLFTDPDRAAEAVRTALAEGFVKDYELSLRSAAGVELVVSLNASTFKDTQDKVAGILVAARDISERRRLEGERSLLASIVASSTDAIYSYTLDTTVISWNAGAERMFGYSAAEMIGRSVTVCVPLERRGELVARENLVLQGGVQQFETRRRCKDGSQVDVSVTSSPLNDNQGNVTGVASICRDITERKRFELELTKARDEALEGERVSSEFLANMSHEIRTPLNSIIGITAMLLDGGEIAEEQRRHLRGVNESATGLLSILNDILDFSKLSAGKASFQTIDLDLEQVLFAALNPFAEAARRKGLEFIASIEPDVPQQLRGDPDRIRQVLSNLLNNAVKFTERGEIVLRVSKLSESPTEVMLRFELRDTGIGISAQAQSRLFAAFSQADVSIAVEYGGSGLGLAIARQLVEGMGGTIGVVSAPGAGSNFWFTAKLAKQPAALKKPRPAAPSVEGVRALIVDDNPINREVLTAQLGAWKMVPDTAARPVEALEMMCREARQRRPYTFALLDLEMPEMNGIELARQVRRLPEIAGTPIIILSSAPKTAELARQAAEVGIKSLLLKPLKQSELFESMTEAMGSAALDLSPQRSTSQPQSSTLTPITTPQGGPLRVLLAEDNAANREVALWQLQKLGCLVDWVVNGREALGAIAKKPYDVILMDCRMPKMDGYEATHRIRQYEGAARHTRIIAMTANALTGDPEKCLAAGMDDYVSKPVSVDKLAAVLRRGLEIQSATSLPVPADTGNGAPAQAPVAVEAQAPVAVEAQAPVAVEAQAPVAAEAEAPVAVEAEAPVAGGAQAPAADGPQFAVVDPATMASLRAKPELLPRLINTVLGEMPEQLKQIADSLATGNHTDAAIVAHSLKGTAKIFGAAQMVALANEVEEAANVEATPQAEEKLDHLKVECARVSRELEEERARLDPGGASG
jgi:two-component system, sensor histidine kinase and response regulator